MVSANLRRYCFFPLVVLIFSCGHNDEKATSKEMPQEQLLKNDMTRYPDSLSVIEKLIEYYRNNGDYDSALAIADNTLKRDSGVAEMWDIKATLHFENGDTANAIKAFETAINIFPLPEYIISLGTLYAETKDKKALTLADALILANRSQAQKEAIFIKGLYYTYTGDKKTAISLFDSCIRMDYTYMFAYREKGVALYDMGRYEDALKVLSKAVTVQNNFDEGYYWMGKCYQQLGRRNEAIQSYQTALMYDADFVEANDSLHALGAR